MPMDLVHVTSYIAPETFEKVEQARKSRARQTRSQWINEAIVEKAEREVGENFSKPAQRATKKKAS